MNAWAIAATVVVGWCALSLLFGVVVGHLIAGRRLRDTFAPAPVLGAVVGAVPASTALSGEAAA